MLLPLDARVAGGAVVEVAAAAAGAGAEGAGGHKLTAVDTADAFCGAPRKNLIGCGAAAGGAGAGTIKGGACGRAVSRGGCDAAATL